MQRQIMPLLSLHIKTVLRLVCISFISLLHYIKQLAVDLMRQRDAHLGAGFQPGITGAGLGSK